MTVELDGFETITSTGLITAESHCGKTRLELGTVEAWPSGTVEVTILHRCEREPEHDGPHYGPKVKTDSSWESWE